MSVLTASPAWEDQIVPTLKKRLESESTYLSNRLSHHGYLDGSSLASSSSRQQHAGNDSFDDVRKRTTSTPFALGAPGLQSHPRQSGVSQPQPQHPGPSRIPISTARRPSHNSTSSASGSVTSSRRPSYNEYPLQATSSISPQAASERPTGLPTLSRPRSKSNLSANNHAFPVDSSIPIPVRTARSNSKDSATPLQVSRLHPNAAQGGVGKEALAHRKSFELSEKKFPEVYLKNELPPFRLETQEAMQIAEKGHDLSRAGVGSISGNSADWKNAHGQGANTEYHPGMTGSLDAGKRKRMESLSKSPARGGPGVHSNIPGVPRSSTGHSLGLGHPSQTGSSSSRQGARAVTTPGGRGIALNSSTGSSGLPRSASLSISQSSNHQPPSLSSSTPTPSRLGVAAHFVPPESSYTPPKGANWDEVVLPTVAKKMNLGEGRRVGIEEMEEGDLAVEWDKSGTPIKWVKRSPQKSSPLLSASQGIVNHGDAPDYDGGDNNGARSGPSSAFSPTFEISTDNPLHNPSNKHNLPNQASSHLPPMRTTHAWDNSSTPPSPAPFSSLDRRLIGDASKLRPMKTGTIEPNSGSGRTMSRGNASGQNSLSGEALVSGKPDPSRAKGGKKDDTHGGGCGCIIM